MAYTQGIDFRATSGFVTDPTNCTFDLGASADYPFTTPQGNNVGWEQAPSGGGRDRNAGIDVRVAGLVFTTGAVTSFRLDLPSSGTYQINLAVGDASNSFPNQKLELFDGAASLGVLCSGNSTGADEYFDATGTLRASNSIWATANPLGGGGSGAISKVFSTSIMRFKIGDGSNITTLCHVFVVQTAGGSNPYNPWSQRGPILAT